MFDVKDTCFQKDEKRFRAELKSKIVEMQRERFLKQIICQWKADQILSENFEFNWKMQKSLVEFPSEEAKVIFMLRTRMLPLPIRITIKVDGELNAHFVMKWKVIPIFSHA